MNEEHLQCEGVTLDSTAPAPLPQVRMEASLPSLPPEILLKVFGNLDTKTLLSCRLICNLWNNLVVNDPSLMRKITFTVDNMQDFEFSSVGRKALSIKIKNEYIGLTGNVDGYFSKIAIEKLIIDFNKKAYICDGYQLFQLLVSSCSTLKELEVIGTYTGPGTIRKLKDQEISLFGSNLKCLTLNRNNLQSRGCEFLLSLPNLSCVKLINPDVWIFEPEVFETICIHMQSFPGILKLVEMAGGNGRNHYGREPYYRFLLNAKKYGVELRLGFRVRASLDGLLIDIEYGEDEEEPGIAITQELCELVTKGTILVFEGDNISNLRRFTNLNSLEIEFLCSPKSEQLSFLASLQNLQELSIKSEYIRFVLAIPEQVFFIGFPSIQYVEAKGDIFRLTDFALFSSAFPNLRRLKLCGQKRLPEDLFCSLDRLEKFEFLEVSNCEYDSEDGRTVQFSSDAINALAKGRSVEITYVDDDSLDLQVVAKR